MLRTVLREPLLHFVLIGALVFFAFELVSEPEPAAPISKKVVVTPAQAEQIAERYRETWRRAPTAGELDTLIDGFVREEILVREALALSMDANDPVIRSRLAQKMEFLIESAAASQEPTEEVLLAHYQDNLDVYKASPQLMFEQILLGDGTSEAEITEILDRLQTGASPDQFGRRTLLPPAVGPTGPRSVEGTFGRGFFEAVAGLDAGVWAGPVASGYGLHLVRVASYEPASVIPFDEVRDRVEADWRAKAAQELAEEVYVELRSGYDVILPGDEALEGLVR